MWLKNFDNHQNFRLGIDVCTSMLFIYFHFFNHKNFRTAVQEMLAFCPKVGTDAIFLNSHERLVYLNGQWTQFRNFLQNRDGSQQ